MNFLPVALRPPAFLSRHPLLLEQRGGAFHVVTVQSDRPLDCDRSLRRAALPRHHRPEASHVGLRRQPGDLGRGAEAPQHPGPVRSSYIQGNSRYSQPPRCAGPRVGCRETFLASPAGTAWYGIASS